MAVRLAFSPSSLYVIDSIRPVVNVCSQLPDRYIVHTDFTTHQRVSIQVVFSGGTSFVVDRVHPVVNVKHQNPRV